MKNRRLEVQLGKTVNLGNYENYKIEVGLAADIGDDVLINDTYHDLFSEVGKQLLVNSEVAKDRGGGRSNREDTGKRKDSTSRFRGRG